MTTPTHFTGPVVSANGFQGDISTGAVAATTITASSTLGVTGVSSFANGTAALPSVTFTSDPDTGLYRVGANSVGLAANGVVQLTITTGGINGIIGATTPAAGAFTTVTASTSMDGIVGGVTPAAGTFTNVTTTGFERVSTANALTAVGTTRTDALALTKGLNVVSTAAASTGVVLPASATIGIGGRVIIFNNGANPIQVYAAGSDTIDGTAGSTGVALANAKRCQYIVTASGTLLSAQLGAVSA